MRFLNLGTTIGGKCFINGVLASISLAVLPLDAAVLTSSQATFVQNTSSLVNTNFGTQTNLQVANRSDAARKAYIEFNLAGQLAAGETFGTSSLTITTTGTPLIGTASGNLTFSIYGLTNGSSWSETTLTWSNSNTVGNNTANNTTLLDSATTLLGTISINSNTVTGGQSFVLSTPALLEYLNWAAGKLGDHFQTGVTSDLTPTFIITAAGSTLGSAGINFASDEFATAASRPSLSVTAVPEPGTIGLIAVGLFTALQLRRLSRAGSRN